MTKPIDAFPKDIKKLDSFFARETKDPLTQAFPGKITIHAGGMADPVAVEQIDSVFASLAQTPRWGKTTVYIHVPFCESHCLYCGFYRKKYDESQSSVYADALVEELQFSAQTPWQETGPVHAVYIGGGTPTSLEAVDLKRILLAVKQYLPLSNDCEITVEGRIRNFGPEKMTACMEGGANRFSIGVQTFDSALRQSMKRLADQDEVRATLNRLKGFDQAAVVIDLIYGFPGQTMAMWEKDIKILQEMELDGADLYQLNIFPGTPLHTAIEKGKISPGIDQAGRARMYARGVEMVDEAMYKRLTVNHWGRTSRERNIYNHLMKTPSTCLAFGPGAGGSIHNHFFLIETDYGKWQTSVLEQGRKPVTMMQRPSDQWVLEKTIAGELELCRINFKRIGEAFGLPLEHILFPLYDQWARAGLVEKKGDWVLLTTAGQFWQVNIVQLTISYLNNIFFKEK